MEEMQHWVHEPERCVPVAFDGDVVVAGAGISGLLAAVAAAREGAKTALVDRFGSLGGNIGPGLVVGGSLFAEARGTVMEGLQSLPLEFQQRIEALRTGRMSEMTHSGYRHPDSNYLDEASIVSYLGVRMAQEADVHLFLSCYASNPMLKGRDVAGLFIESKSGRVALKARVVVDATGDADVARRAGAPLIRHVEPDEQYQGMIREAYLRRDYRYHNEVGVLCVVGGMDGEVFRSFLGQDLDLSEDDDIWIQNSALRLPSALVPAVRSAFECSEYPELRQSQPGVTTHGPLNFRTYEGGVMTFWLQASGEIDTDDAEQVSHWETALRVQAFEWARLLREHARGCQGAYLLFASPFMGARGGSCIEGEHVLTPQECFQGARFADVLYRNIHEGLHGGAKSGFDVPFRILIPKGVDGLLVTGRGASYIRRGHDPSGMRARPSMMTLGEVTGIAAALAARIGIPPRQLQVRTLQTRLLEKGIFLGEQDRLQELGLASAEGDP